MLETILHKFYAATISIGLDGAMLVASNRDRVMAWGMMFCILAASSLIAFLVWRSKRARRVSLSIFVITLLIPVFVMPSVKREYIHITPDQITIDTGDWYQDSKTVLQLANLDYIREQEYGSIPSNLIGDPNVVWQLFWKDGNQHQYELNDFFNAHRMVVAYYFKDRGMRLERLEDQFSAIY